MYEPLIKAFNDALHQLSSLDVPGLPEFQEGRAIVFGTSAKKYILTETPQQGSYKPDLILVKWSNFKTVYEREHAAYSESYESDLCSLSPAGSKWFTWRNLLSTIEVKLGGPRNARKAIPENGEYSQGFGELHGDRASNTPLKDPQGKPPVAVSEENPTRSCESSARLGFLASHRLQLRHVPI